MLNYQAIRNYYSFEDLINKSNYKFPKHFSGTLGKALKKVKKELVKRCKWA